jgi:hypothetical protein
VFTLRWVTAGRILTMTTALDNNAAAAALGISPITLKIWRCKGRGPRFTKLSDSKRAGVRYDPADIEAWKAARKFDSTSAATVSHPDSKS